MRASIVTLATSAPMTIRQDDDLELALQVMTWGEIRHLPVMGGDALVGVLSERDILRRYADVGRSVAARERVGLAMSSPAVTIGPNDTVASAIELVTERRIGCLPVIERGHVLGIVTRQDLLALGIRQDQVDWPKGSESLRASWARVLDDALMSCDLPTASRDDTIGMVLDRMGRHGIRHLLVMDVERRVIGMLSDRELLTRRSHIEPPVASWPKTCGSVSDGMANEHPPARPVAHEKGHSPNAPDDTATGETDAKPSGDRAA